MGIKKRGRLHLPRAVGGFCSKAESGALNNASFDAMTFVEPSAEFLAEAVPLLRKIGLNRLFYGTDAAARGMPTPHDWWRAIGKLPLTDEELRDIADNVPPYMR